MDQVVKPKKKWKKLLSLVLVAIFLTGLGWMVYAASGSQSISIDSDQIDTAMVTKTTFEEGISITGRDYSQPTNLFRCK